MLNEQLYILNVESLVIIGEVSVSYQDTYGVKIKCRQMIREQFTMNTKF